MREILFRGKRKLRNQWVEGSLHTEKFTDDEEYLCCEVCQCDVYPETVGQFIGFVDVNGKKIFEGDIGKSIDGLFLVRWSEEKSAFVMNFYDYPYEELYLEEMWEDSEIIGNIHDKPELLRTPQNDEVRE